MTTIVFSKDRALQLDAFLRSYRDHVTPPLGRVHVLYTATSKRHLAAYQQVFAVHAFAVSHAETVFKADLLALLPTAGNVVFFVDDQIFVRPWTVLEAPGLSLRLGTNLTRNYASGDAPQSLPPFEIADGDLLSWRWGDGTLAWGYPLSLDGHVFTLADIRPLIEASDFTSPNTLESALQRFVPRFLEKRGTCYRLSKVVNVPWNRVQRDYDNRFSRDTYATPDRLLSVWEGGEQVDLQPLSGVLNESCHQEFPLMLEARA